MAIFLLTFYPFLPGYSGLPLERDDSMYRGKGSSNRVQFADTVIKTRAAKLREAPTRSGASGDSGSHRGSNKYVIFFV